MSPCNLIGAIPSALSFWQYQVHQENSYQQSVLTYANEKNAELQKQLDDVIREGKWLSSAPNIASSHAFREKANGELNSLSSKIRGRPCKDRALCTP